MMTTQNIDKKILEEVQMRMDIENLNLEKTTGSNASIINKLYHLGDKIAPLSKEEKNYLAVQAKLGNQKASETLLATHAKLAIQIATKKYKQMYTVPISASLEDLVMSGCLGVAEAIKSFDPVANPDISFTTYAVYFITKEVNQAYIDARPIKISEHIMERTILMKKTCDMLQKILHHEPSEQELYNYYDGEYSLDIIRDTLELIRNTGTISLFEKFGEGSGRDEDEGLLINAIADNSVETPDEIVAREEKRRIIREAVDKLPRREALVIKYLFGLTEDDKSYTLLETAKILSSMGMDGPKNKPLSKQYIANLRESALAKLRETIPNLDIF